MAQNNDYLQNHLWVKLPGKPAERVHSYFTSDLDIATTHRDNYNRCYTGGPGPGGGGCLGRWSFWEMVVMSQNGGSLKRDHPVLLCVFGMHDWILKGSKYAGAVAEFGGYGFLPNTEYLYECSCCRKKMSIVKDYKGDVIS